MNAEVGAFCSLSWNVSVGGGDHDTSRVTTHSFLYNERDSDLRPSALPPVYDRLSRDVIVGSDVWIGSGATVLRGVRIGHGAVVGASSLVNRDVGPYEVWAGVPARKIRDRFPPDVRTELLRLKWWDLEDSQIRKLFPILSAVPELQALRNLNESATE